MKRRRVSGLWCSGRCERQGMNLALRRAEFSLRIRLGFGIPPRISPRGAHDFTARTPCLRGENTVLRGDFASSRIYGFLKDLDEWKRMFCRTVPCISFVLNNLRDMWRVFSRRRPEFPCNCSDLKDLDEWKRMFCRTVPCISFVLNNLRDMWRVFSRRRPEFPCNCSDLKDLG